MNVNDVQVQHIIEKFDQMRESMSSAREVIQSLQAKVDASELDTQDGISLLALKSQLMLSYLQSLVLVSARRVLGHSLDERTPPTASFANIDREARGNGAGDRVDAMIEGRVVLEKIKILEGRMRYQIDKLVRVAEEPADNTQNVVNDPLAFKPNPQDLLNQEMDSDEEDEGDRKEAHGRDDIYRPPKLAPMPYTDPQTSKDRTRREPVPSALTSLAHMDPSMPYTESTSGLGSTPALMSKRAKELQRMAEFEEENFTRLVMKKKDAKRRKQDEADLALGGTGSTGRHGRGGGLEDEFGDIIRSVGRSRAGIIGDGYEELRQKGKKRSVVERSRVGSRGDLMHNGEDGGPRQRKRSRFEKEVKASKRTSVHSRQ